VSDETHPVWPVVSVVGVHKTYAHAARPVRADGQDLAPLSHRVLTLLRRRRVGFVFQAFDLFTVALGAGATVLASAVTAFRAGWTKCAGPGANDVALGEPAAGCYNPVVV
jgi:hypothetical protein